MMGRTDRHCRYFLRGFSARMLLYTEMTAAADLMHGDWARLLEFDPVVTQPFSYAVIKCTVPGATATSGRSGVVTYSVPN